ncbi:DUF1805 domain-containing protein [Cohnella endophytica]|uniref:DUF1805 domain-containing protein n=1 Tax=Cohnella endophytica TaxID=2419778 RepID=A0A494Y1D7_9BACL|nr:DUF1805 domain-containing protein [Cohnella endophytica]RKP54162.1 DUF1805 domain-containing protein [Cohnella endophytica]
MVRVVPMQFEGWSAVGVEVLLPKTTLLSISVGDGYIMCGALDVQLLNTKLKDRNIVAGRAVGVRTFEQLLEAPLESVTDAAQAIGIHVGMSGQEALGLMAQATS